MTLEVLKYPNPLLRRNCKRVETFDEQLRQTATAMLETMYAQRGVGLAASQVGIDLQMLVLNSEGDKDKTDLEKVIINPELLSRKKLEYGEEGCLSFPGIYAEVERHRDIKLRYQDLDGQEHEETMSGFLARIVLHEYDHLTGTLFVDRLSAAERIRVRSRLSELEKNFKQAANSD